MQKSRLLIEKMGILKKTCEVCFRNFQMDPRDHEKNSTKSIVVDLRILGEV
jgi:hypothetical protein